MSRILIVDDSPVVRSLQSYALRSAGFEPDTAANGIEALEKVYANRYELIIADINMPKMDGLKFVRTLREHEEYRGLPVIIVTSESEEADRVRGIEAGANVYLVKPTDPEQLIQNVRMLLA